jgi:hypothetical protein
MSESEKEEYTEIDLSYFEKEGQVEFVEKLKFHKDKTSKAFQELVVNIKTEASETHEASKILVKYLREGDISKEEEQEFRTQVYDLLKVLGIGIPFALIPGASLLMPFLVKMAQKKGIQILPTAFNQDEKSEDEKI